MTTTVRGQSRKCQRSVAAVAWLRRVQPGVRGTERVRGGSSKLCRTTRDTVTPRLKYCLPLLLFPPQAKVWRSVMTFEKGRSNYRRTGVEEMTNLGPGNVMYFVMLVRCCG